MISSLDIIGNPSSVHFEGRLVKGLIENSYNTKASKHNIKSAQEKVWETTSTGLPQISGNVEYQNWIKQQVSLADFNGDGTDEVFVFGKKQGANAFLTVQQLLFNGSYLVGLQASKTYLKIC